MLLQRYYCLRKKRQKSNHFYFSETSGRFTESISSDFDNLHARGRLGYHSLLTLHLCNVDYQHCETPFENFEKNSSPPKNINQRQTVVNTERSALQKNIFIDNYFYKSRSFFQMSVTMLNSCILI